MQYGTVKTAAGLAVRLACLASAQNTQPNAIILDEMPMVVGEFLWGELVDGVATLILGQAGVRQDGNLLGRIEREVTDRIVHFLRPGGAIRANGIDFKRLQRG